MKPTFKFTAALVAVALVMGIGATALLVAMAPALAAAPTAGGAAPAAMPGVSDSSPPRCRRR